VKSSMCRFCVETLVTWLEMLCKSTQTEQASTLC
jgi:hypothetical protein